MSTRNSFKSSSSSRTSEVLVTFSAKWKKPLLSGSIACVLRRRYPKSIIPTRMYLYIAAPYSQVIAAANITKIMDVDLAQAKAMKQKTQVDDDDLVEYFKGYNTIGCYFIEEPKFFQSVIQLEELREKWFFYPPQSFISLSREAVEWLTCKSSSTPT